MYGQRYGYGVVKLMISKYYTKLYFLETREKKVLTKTINTREY